ncbi:hypothetical protein GCM10027519_17170 [Kineococcus endophyticus]
MGQVQHYFATKDDMLLDTLRRSYAAMERHVHEQLSAGQQTPSEEGSAEDDVSERDVLVAVLDQLLAPDRDTQNAIRIGTAFAVRARQDARVAAVLTDGDADIVALATSVIAEGVAAGRVAASVDPELAARGLFALATGLGGQVALYGASSADAREVLHHHLALVAPTDE